MDFQLGGLSPLQARQTFPFMKMLIIVAIIVIALGLLWFCAKKIKEYFHSEKYIAKAKERITTRKDVAIYARTNHLSQKKEDLLWEVCNITKCPNINYNLKTEHEIINLFRMAYFAFFEKGISDEKLNEFFLLLYRLECILALSKGVSSTKLLPIGMCVFYISEVGEQFPLYVIRNTENGFTLEIPEFLYNSPHKPKLLARQKFSFKTNNGLAYNFISRITRYEESTDGQFTIIVAHCDELVSTTQRQYKRENYEAKCHFSPIQINTEKKDGSAFVFSNKVYEGNLTNISAGGCCIQTNLPIKEHQHICVLLKELGISERIVGVIKNTGKLTNGDYLLHIQFIRITPAARNRIFALIYKYEL